MDLYKTLLDATDNYSEFSREAIIEKLEREGNPEILKTQRQKYQEAIKRIDEKLKTKKEGSQKIKEILEFGYESYKKNWILYEDDWQCSKIQERILPALKEAGCDKYSVKDILLIFRKRHAQEKEVRDDV